MPRKTKTNLPQAEFVDIFNSSDGYDEIIARTGLTLGYIQVRAWQLRKKGVELRYFPVIRRTGVYGWLKEKYPQVYQDLKNNYPDVFSAYYGK